MGDSGVSGPGSGVVAIRGDESVKLSGSFDVFKAIVRATPCQSV